MHKRSVKYVYLHSLSFVFPNHCHQHQGITIIMSIILKIRSSMRHQSKYHHVIAREEPLLSRIHTPKPVLVHLLRFFDFCVPWEIEFVFLRHEAAPSSQTSLSYTSVRRQLLRCLCRSFVFFESQSTHHVTDDDALLTTFRRVLETDDGHAMIFQTSSPPVWAISL
jgi:hypothetical protein